MSKLSTEDLAQHMARHPEWQLTPPWLARDIQFKNFAEAWRFMNLIAEHAEAQEAPTAKRAHRIAIIYTRVGYSVIIRRAAPIELDCSRRYGEGVDFGVQRQLAADGAGGN